MLRYIEVHGRFSLSFVSSNLESDSQRGRKCEYLLRDSNIG